MNHMRLTFYASIALAILLAACAPSSTPTPVVIVVTATPVPATETPVPPTVVPPTAPNILAGPPMQVGSTYLYFDGALLVAVPGGPFLMGHGGSDNPEHTVTLSDFWIYSTKITNMEFQQCVAVGKCTEPNLQDNQGYNDPRRQSDPVVGVSWAQGEAYCEYAHGHLPTEAQWEKTARGPDGNVYPWGSNAPAKDLLNYNNLIGQTTNVINYPKGKSYYSALEMEGNVYEWAYDWYDPFYYKTGPTQDPQGPDSSTSGNRSVRSGGYKSNDDQVIPSTRFFKNPADHARDLGFRCVVKDPTFFAPMCRLFSIVGPDLNAGSGPVSAMPTPQTLNITVGYSGCGDNSYAVVSFDDSYTPPPDPNLNIPTPPSGCSKNANPQGHVEQWTCTKAVGGVQSTSSCVYSGPLVGHCPQHYDLIGGSCVWNGSGTEGQNCPAGTTYDPVNKCCTSSSGTGTNSSACPAGSFVQDMGGGNYQCLPGNAQCNVIPGQATIDDPQQVRGACGTTNGGNPGGSQCPPGQTYTCGGITNQQCGCR